MLLDSIYARAKTQPPSPSCNQQGPATPLLSPSNVEIGREERSNCDFFNNCDSSPSPPPASHYDWSSSSLLCEPEKIPPLRNPSSSPGSSCLIKERRQKPIAQFGLDPSLIRSQTQSHDDFKSLGLPSCEEYQEVTKSLLHDVLAKVGLAEDSCSSPDIERFSCYADLNSYDVEGAKRNDVKPCPKIEERESQKHFSYPSNQPATSYSFPSSVSSSDSANHIQQDLSMDGPKQEKEDSNGSAFLVLKPLSSLTIGPVGNRSDSPLRTALSSSPTVSVDPTSNNLPSSSSQSEENCVIVSSPSNLASAPTLPSQEVSFEDSLSSR